MTRASTHCAESFKCIMSSKLSYTTMIPPPAHKIRKTAIFLPVTLISYQIGITKRPSDCLRLLKPYQIDIIPPPAACRGVRISYHRGMIMPAAISFIYMSCQHSKGKNSGKIKKPVKGWILLCANNLHTAARLTLKK